MTRNCHLDRLTLAGAPVSKRRFAYTERSSAGELGTVGDSRAPERRACIPIPKSTRIGVTVRRELSALRGALLDCERHTPEVTRRRRSGSLAPPPCFDALPAEAFVYAARISSSGGWKASAMPSVTLCALCGEPTREIQTSSAFAQGTPQTKKRYCACTSPFRVATPLVEEKILCMHITISSCNTARRRKHTVHAQRHFASRT